jgi:hypothetical protein
MSYTRIPCPIPPQYDIDTLLNVDLTAPHVAFEVMNKIYEAIEKLPRGNYSFRPDSALLMPEVVVRDLCNFDMSMGNGFYACLGYGGGFTCFFRALRALRIIQHKKGSALAEAVRDVMVANGAREPSSFDDDNHEGTDVDWDEELKDMGGFFDQIEKPIRHLDNVNDGWHDISHAYWDRCNRVLVPEDPPLHYAVCKYLDANRDLLRCRKGNP